MIFKTSTGSDFEVVMEGDPGVGNDTIYLGTKIGTHIGTTGALTVYDIMVYDGSHSASATYYSTPDGDLDIDLHNLVVKAQKAGVGSSAWIKIDSDIISLSDTDTMLMAVTIDNGNSYNDIWAPYGRDCVSVVTDAEDPHIVTPPNIIWTDPTGPAPVIESNAQNVAWRQFDAYGVGTLPTVSNNLITMDSGTVSLRVKRDENYYFWNFKLQGDCEDLMLIQWISRTGRTKLAYFPVISKISDISALDIDVIGNGFEALKNHQECYRCRLDGLTPYSLWYYADLLFSPSVKASLDHSGKITDIFATDLANAVVMGDTADVKIGYDMRSFEFIVKLRHYDSF